MPVPSEAAVERHPHLADEVPDGWVRVDLHSHSMWSGDCTTTPDELTEGVAASGIDVLCLTDHGTINGAVELADGLPCRVIVGQEVRTRWGEIIGLFLTERIPTGRPPVEVAEAIRDQGGLVYIPHPFDPLRANLAEDALVDLLDRGLVDAMEGRNAKTSLEHLNRRAQEVAAGHDVAVGAGSDAHVPDAIGAAYAEVPEFADAAGLLAGLRAGRIRGHHWDQPRPWRPRIVPSTSAL